MNWVRMKRKLNIGLDENYLINEVEFQLFKNNLDMKKENMGLINAHKLR